MKRKILNKIMALIISTSMLFSSIPTTVLAEEESVTTESTTETTEEVDETTELPTEITTELPTESTTELTTESTTELPTEEDFTEEDTTEITTEAKTEESTEIIDDDDFVVFDHIYNKVDTSNIKTTSLFIQTSDASVFTKNTNVVSNYDDVYIIDCENLDEAKSVYSYYLDKVDFICDLQDTIELSDNEASKTNADEEDTADLSDVNTDSDDAIANIETIVNGLTDEAEEENDDLKPEETGYEDYIALIDSGINENEVTLGEFDYNISVIDSDTEIKTDDEDKKITDNVGHGTKMYSYIKEEYPDAKVLSIKAFDDKTSDVASIYAAIQVAIEKKVKVINLSFVGPNVESNAIIKDILQEAIDKGITVIGSAGNNKSSAKNFISGCIEDVISIGAVNEDGTLYKTSNYDADKYVVAESTSEAAARYSGIVMSGIESDKVFDNYKDYSDKPENNNTKYLTIGVSHTYNTSVTSNTDLMHNHIDDLLDYYSYKAELSDYDDNYYVTNIKDLFDISRIKEYVVTLNNSNGIMYKNAKVDLTTGEVLIPKVAYTNSININTDVYRIDDDSEITEQDIEVDSNEAVYLEMLSIDTKSDIPINVNNKLTNSSFSFDLERDFYETNLNIPIDKVLPNNEFDELEMNNIKIFVNGIQLSTEQYYVDDDYENFLVDYNVGDINNISIIIDKADFTLTWNWSNDTDGWDNDDPSYTIKNLNGLWPGKGATYAGDAYVSTYLGSDFTLTNTALYNKIMTNEKSFVDTHGPVDFVIRLAPILNSIKGTTGTVEDHINYGSGTLGNYALSIYHGKYGIESNGNVNVNSANGDVLMACHDHSKKINSNDFWSYNAKVLVSDSEHIVLRITSAGAGQICEGKITIDRESSAKAGYALTKMVDGVATGDIYWGLCCENATKRALLTPSGDGTGHDFIMKTSNGSTTLGTCNNIYSREIFDHISSGGSWDSNYKNAQINAANKDTTTHGVFINTSGIKINGIKMHLVELGLLKYIMIYYYNSDNVIVYQTYDLSGNAVGGVNDRPADYNDHYVWRDLSAVNGGIGKTCANNHTNVYKVAYGFVNPPGIANSNMIDKQVKLKAVDDTGVPKTSATFDNLSNPYHIRFTKKEFVGGAFTGTRLPNVLFDIQCYYNGVYQAAARVRTDLYGNFIWDFPSDFRQAQKNAIDAGQAGYSFVVTECPMSEQLKDKLAKEGIAGHEISTTPITIYPIAGETHSEVEIFWNGYKPDGVTNMMGEMDYDAFGLNPITESDKSTYISNEIVPLYDAIQKVNEKGEPVNGVPFIATIRVYDMTTKTQVGATITTSVTTGTFTDTDTGITKEGIAWLDLGKIASTNSYDPKLIYIVYQETQPTDPNVKHAIWDYYDETTGTYPNRNVTAGHIFTTSNWSHTLGPKDASGNYMHKADYINAILNEATTGFDTVDLNGATFTYKVPVNEHTTNDLRIKKSSSKPGISENNPNYDLAGAVYKIYRTQDDAKNDRSSIGTMKTDSNGDTWVTDASGENWTLDGHGNKIPYINMYNYMTSVPGNSILKQDTDFYLVETHVANRGYIISTPKDTPMKITVRADRKYQTFNVTDTPIDDPFRLRISKIDAFGNKSTDLKNEVEFTYKYYAAPMWDSILTRDQVINNYQPKFDGKITLNANNNGLINITELSVLANDENFPRGYVVLDEVKWPDNYNATDKKILVDLGNGQTKDITDDFYFITDGELKTNDAGTDNADYTRVTWYPNGATTYNELINTKGIKFIEQEETVANVADIEITAINSPIRSNIKLKKVNEITNEPMEGVKFSITNVLTGEKHYIFTDENGEATTAIVYDPNKSFNDNYGEHCNYYDDTIDDDGNVISKDYDPSITDATVWFGKDTDGKWNEPDDWQLDTLPEACWGAADTDNTIGTYIIKEERCAANSKVYVDDKEYKYQLFPAMDSHLSEAHHTYTIFDPNATESDEIIYNTKLPEVWSQAWVEETSIDPNTINPDQPIDPDQPINPDQPIDPDQPVDPDQPIDPDQPDGQTDDNTDDETPVEDNGLCQSLANESKDFVASSTDIEVDWTNQTIYDEFFYEKLKAGTTYALYSKLMLVTEVTDEDGKETGEYTVKQFTDKDGNDVEQMNKFTTSENYSKTLYEKEGSYVVKFPGIDVTGIDEKHQHFVVYQYLYLDEDYADLAALKEAIKAETFKTRYDGYTEKDDMDFFPIVHDDMYNTSESIYPTILHTTIANNPTVDRVGMATTTTITDRCYYKGLTIGKEYTVTGSIVVKDGTDFTNIEYDPKNPDANEEGFVTTVTTETDTTPTDDQTDDTDDHGNTPDDINVQDDDFNNNPNKAYFLRDADGNVVTVSKTFTATSKDGYVDLEFEVDATELAGKSTVAFEKLTYGPVILGTHTDIHDEDETVHFPKIGTTTRNSQIDEKDIKEDEPTTNTTTQPETTNDTVDNTQTETTDTNHTDTNQTDNSENNNNTSNTDVVNPIASDTNIKVDGSKACSKQVKAAEGESFVDKIHYENLLANRKYYVKGTLMDKATGEIMKDASGKEITAEMYYETPEVSEVVIDKSPRAVNYILLDGTILDLTGDHADYLCTGDIELTFNGYDFTNLADKIGVVFEEIYLVKEDTDSYKDEDNKPVEVEEKIIVAEHKDITDVDQFTYFIEIGTKAEDDTTKIPLVPYGTDTILKDTVTYKNVIPNKEYTLTAKVVVKDDKSGTYKDGDFLKDKNGEDVIATVKFTPTAENSTIIDGMAYGEIVVDIPINTETIKGLNLVVFEDMTNMYGISVATHADINDEGQTIKVPDAHTTALGKESESNEIESDKNMEVYDIVYYENLVPGKEYEVTGTVYRKDTEKPLEQNGKIVTNTVKFTPEKPNGEIHVPFTIDTTELYNQELVVFEDVTYNKVPVIIHHDINDKDQTFHVSMTLNVSVAKGDKDKTNYFLKGAEITIYNQDGTIAKDINGKECVGTTDANGLVSFDLKYSENNTYYAKETKAPSGYSINSEKFEIKAVEKGATRTIDEKHRTVIKVTILDTAIVIPPKTGEFILFTMIGLIAIGTCGVLVFRKKKKVKTNN